MYTINIKKIHNNIIKELFKKNSTERFLVQSIDNYILLTNAHMIVKVPDNEFFLNQDHLYKNDIVLCKFNDFTQGDLIELEEKYTLENNDITGIKKVVKYERAGTVNEQAIYIDEKYKKLITKDSKIYMCKNEHTVKLNFDIPHILVGTSEDYIEAVILGVRINE